VVNRVILTVGWPLSGLPRTTDIIRAGRHVSKVPIQPVPNFPRLRALALFGRRPPQRVDSLLMPASENLHRSERAPG
jgi:hypothetical protein